MIEKNVARVKAEIAVAAAKRGVDPHSITLVAATKMNDGEAVRRAIKGGVDACGENRVQELVQKNGEGAYQGAPLHFIGHLQRYNVKQVVGVADLIESVDSDRLALEIEKTAENLGIVQKILVEVNIGGEDSKSGISPEELPGFLARLDKMPHLKTEGLMTITPIGETPEETRPYFKRMYRLFLDMKDKKYDNVTMKYLSMGMSGDFACAVEEGANMVRVGTAIFGQRNY